MAITWDKAINFQSKNRRIIRWISIVLFLILLLVQLFGKKELLFVNFDSPLSWSFGFMLLLLMPLNWGIERLKWVSILRFEKVSMSKKDTTKSFASGMISGFLSPSYFGNFLGRLSYFEAEQGKRIVSLTMLSNSAQFLSSLLFGLAALVIMPDYDFLEGLSWVYVLIGLALLALYFSFDKIRFLRIFAEKKGIAFGTLGLRSNFLILSLIRYLVFSFQYILMLSFFNGEVVLSDFVAIWLIYLLMTLSPSLLFGKLLVRETWSVLILTSIGYSASIALLSALILWLVNNVLPTLISFFIAKK
jgi:hypothetical protein